MNDLCIGTPTDWPKVTPEVVVLAKERVLTALAVDGVHRAQDRLVVFYDTESNYAGSSFAELCPNDWWDITPTDMHATSLLSVTVGPEASRRLLMPGAARSQILRRLRALPDRDLDTADADTMSGMNDLYQAVKTGLSSSAARHPNPWVTASKLCARKRPALFPVRDRNVCVHLGILELNDFRLDCQVFRALVQDPEVRAAIDILPANTREIAAGRRLAIDTTRLRLMDAALWTYTVWY